MADSPLTQAFTATGPSANTVTLTEVCFNVSRYGNGVGVVDVERSFDEGVTWLVVRSLTANFEGLGKEIDRKVLYRFNCTTYTSGTINARLSRGSI